MMIFHKFCNDFHLVIFVCAILDLTYPPREQDQQIYRICRSVDRDPDICDLGLAGDHL